LLTDLWYSNLLWNMFFNAGFFFVDFVYLAQIWGLSMDEDHTVPYHYAFFSGDLSMRVIYRDEED
jgi:hypothetical protein